MAMVKLKIIKNYCETRADKKNEFHLKLLFYLHILLYNAMYLSNNEHRAAPCNIYRIYG